MENNVGVAEDRISELPDSILHDQILSRLPTKLAVSTSILSKRWRWLWTGVPALEFSYTPSRCSEPEEATMFMNYVDNVLLHHQISNVRSFKLTCDEACAKSCVRSWLSAVAHENLCELYLWIYELDFDVIPQSIYRCERLVELKISSNRGVFAPPTSISLPSLTALELDRLIFEDEELTQQFFFSLSALKRLVLQGCTFYNHENLVISVPSLSHLRIYDARFEPYEPCARMIKICAPNLDYLYCWTDALPSEYVLFDMPMLQEAMINTDVYYNSVLTEEEVRRNAHNLLKDLINVKKLHIPADLLAVLPHEDLMSHLPTFTNLTYLRVIGPCRGKDLLSVLRIMPNLEDLIFDKVYTSSEDELTSYIGGMLPQCFESRIKKFQINEFDGSPEDLCIINFLLANVAALEIPDVIDARDLDLNPVKLVRLGRHSLNLSRSVKPMFFSEDEWLASHIEEMPHQWSNQG